MKNNNFVRVIAIVSSLILIISAVTGCNSKTSQDESTSPAASVEPSAVAPSPTVAAPSPTAEASAQTSQNPSPADTSTSTIYENTTYGIKFAPPSGWEKREGIAGTVVAYLSPKEGDSDNFQENVNVVVQDLSAQPMDLKKYTELSLAQLKQVITNATIEINTETTLAGQKAQKLVYTGKQGEFNLKWQQVWTIKNNKAYIITFTTAADKFSNYSKVADDFVNSLEIK